MKIQAVIHYPEKFVSKSFSETLETTNSGLVWMSFRSHYAHNFSNYESRLNIEYMPSGEQFSEQRDNWATPYKFNDYEGESFNKAFDEHTARSAELDQETGLYYYGARYYTPEIGIWLSVDPLSDKYPSMSAYMYCAGNPVILVDPDGREMTLVITGPEAEAAKNNLQQSTTMKLDRDEKTGVVTTKDSPKTNNDERLFEVLRDPDHTAILDASSSNEVSHEGKLYDSYGGSFMGSDFTEENGVTKGTATNAVNPSKLSIIDLVFGRPGQSMLHEATEAFEAAKISASEKVKAGPAKGDNPVYDRADKAATGVPINIDPAIFEIVPKVQQSYKMMTR